MEETRGVLTRRYVMVRVCDHFCGGARLRTLIDWVQLIVTVLNPWQWFCSTRTLSNCLETTLTVVALDLWPWQWSAGLVSEDSRDKSAGSERGMAEGRTLLWKYDWIDRTD